MAKLVALQPLGGSLYLMTEVDPAKPGQGLPGTRPDQGLPGAQPGPDQGLPPTSGIPSNELPSTPPPQVQPGATLVLIRGPEGKWAYAVLQPGMPMPEPLPEQPAPQPV